MQTILPSQQDLKKKLFHKQTQIISDQQKYPQLFKWKTATLIMGTITAILLIILLVVIYNIEAEPQIVTNLTFLSSIVLQTKILQNKEQVMYLSHNFQQIYGTTKFQNTRLIYRTNELTQQRIRQKIYSEQNEKLLYLIELNLVQDGNKYPVRFSIFMNSEFPLPKDQDFEAKLAYYSFEIKQQRKSSLLSLHTDQYLKLVAINPQIKSVSECQNYKYEPKYNQRQGSFRLLNELINFSLQSKNVTFNLQGWKCFTPQLANKQQLQSVLKNIIDQDFSKEGVTLQSKTIQIYYLY